MSKRKNTYTSEARKVSEIMKEEREKWRDKRKRSGWIFGTLTWVTQIFLQTGIMYGIGMFIAMSIVPNIVRIMFIVSVKGGHKMTDVLDQIGYWGFPALFVVLALFFAYACLMVLLWRGLNKFFSGWREGHRANIAAKLDVNKKIR